MRNNPLRYTDPSGHYITLYGEPGVRYADIWSQDRRELAVRIDRAGQVHILRGGTEFVNPAEQGLANYYATGNEAYLPEGGGALEGMVGYAANNAAAGLSYERPFTSLANKIGGGYIDPILLMGVGRLVVSEESPDEQPPAGEGMWNTETPWDAAARGGIYVLRDPTTGEVQYVGRTNDLVRRQAEHWRDPVKGQLDFEVDWMTDDYAVQRGREQMLYDLYQPPLNMIRPISPRNPSLQGYLEAARRFGK